MAKKAPAKTQRPKHVVDVDINVFTGRLVNEPKFDYHYQKDMYGKLTSLIEFTTVSNSRAKSNKASAYRHCVAWGSLAEAINAMKLHKDYGIWGAYGLRTKDVTSKEDRTRNVDCELTHVTLKSYPAEKNVEVVEGEEDD